MKNANFPILLAILVLVAVVAQFTRHSGEKPEVVATRLDMEKCLQRLWGQDGQQVQLTPVRGQVDVSAAVDRITIRSSLQETNYRLEPYEKEP